MEQSEEREALKPILEHANALIQRDDKKNRIQQEMLRMHRLEWSESLWTKPENAKETRDTQPWDSVKTSVDVLSVHEPSITLELPREMPEDEEGAPLAEMNEIAAGAFGEAGMMGMPPTLEGMTETEDAGYNHTELGETLEAVVRSALQHNDGRRKTPLLRDFLLSAFLFDEVIAKVADMRVMPQWEELPAAYKRRSPFKVNCVLPMTVYCDWDDFGLAYVLHRYKKPLREVRNQYADLNAAVELFEGDPDGNVVYCEWWERGRYAVWIERSGVKNDERVDPASRTDEELILEPLQKHDYGFVPFVVTSANGGSIFELEEEKISPMLYGGWKSNTFFRSNLFLSVAATLAFAQSNPKWIYGSETGDKTLDLNFNFPEVLPIKQGEKIDRLDVGVNQDIMNMLQEFTSRSERTTISTVAAGQVPHGVSAAAAINLLVQGTKLTIVPAQNAVGKVYSEVAQMILDYIKAYGESDLKIMVRGGVKQVRADQIPAWLNIKVELRADLPQDKALLYNIAQQAWKSGFISRESGWDLVGIEDKVKEQERIDQEVQEATPEEMTQGKVSALAQQKLQAEQMAQQEQMAGADASTTAQAEGLPFEQNPQAGNPVLDQMNAMQNAMGQMG